VWACKKGILFCLPLLYLPFSSRLKTNKLLKFPFFLAVSTIPAWLAVSIIPACLTASIIPAWLAARVKGLHWKDCPPEMGPSSQDDKRSQR